MATLTSAPVGTVALLFTDIEGSTRLARELGATWPDTLIEHHRIVSAAIAEAGGHVDGTEGDAFFATFGDPRDAARAAVAAQRALHEHPWPRGARVRVRMGLHVGAVARNATGYVGLEVHRAARVAAAAHGGQLLLSGAARAAVADVVETQELGRHRLKDFPEPVALFHAVIDGRAADGFPPPKTLDVRPTNLPAGRVALVGREDDLGRVCRAVREGERLVTLVGRGGQGKTSLAISAGEALLDAHPGGVWWVPLASIAPGGLVQAIGASIGAEDGGGTCAERVSARLAGRRALLVLDNVEHVAAEAQVVGDLLAACPHLRVLATSQVPLRLAGELVLPLDELPRDAAVALLVRQAGRVGARVSADDPAAAALVEALDGLPLAIELAANQLRVLRPDQLLERLQRSPMLLRDTGRDRPDRHRSLEATIAWTLGVLDEGSRELFVRMGAFAAPATLDELELVLGDGLDLLGALGTLLDTGLVRRVEAGAEVRFGMPEALRRAAAARLDGSPGGERWRRAHAERQHTLLWAARTAALSSTSDARAAEAAECEADPAITWAAAHDRELWARMAAARAVWITGLGHTTAGEELALAVLAEPAADLEVRAVAAVAQLHAMLTRARLEGVVAEGRPCALALQASDPTTVAHALTVRGMTRCLAGDAGGLDDHAAAVEAVPPGSATRAGAQLLAVRSLLRLGRGADAEAQAAELRTWIDAADAAARVFLDTLDGDLALHHGRHDEALRAYARSLGRSEARGDEVQVMLDLVGCGLALCALRPAAGLEVLGLADAQADLVGGSARGAFAPGVADALQDAARAALGDAAADAARRAGRAVSDAMRTARARQLVAASGQAP